MLQALLDWWRTGVNEVGSQLQDSISAIAYMQGRTLLESEAEARRIEPGDGSPQASVVQKLSDALGSSGSNVDRHAH